MSHCLAVVVVASAGCAGSSATPSHSGATEVALLAGGCFWCVEGAFDGVPGVIDAVSGYTGGPEANPTYEAVGAGRTGHYESVEVRFDPKTISYAQVLDIFWRQIDPTDAGGQFADRGSQYRTAIFASGDEQRRVAAGSKAFLEKSGWFSSPIVTPILPAAEFYRAEEYHQDYHAKNPEHYKGYKWGSGRGPYLERVWKGKPAIVAPAAGERVYPKPSDEVLRARLTPMQYAVTQNDATERAFDNAYWDDHEAGIYVDIVSGEPLFSSLDKFDSGTGWPSFSRPLVTKNVVQGSSSGLGFLAAEVRSRHGDSHLGHVFDDGPNPTGMRYCINSAALRFVPAGDLTAQGYEEYRRLFEPKPGS